MSDFRFGYQIRSGLSLDDIRDQARRAEAAGFDVLSTSDHLHAGWGPIVALQAMADATERIRLCPLVLNNDFHEPALMAMQFANLDHATGGRVEFGIGAGHSFTEYAAINRPFDPPRTRKQRMAEAVEIYRHLFDGETVDHIGEHYRYTNVRTMRSAQDRLPILVGVNGRLALAHAARYADTIGLTMLGRTLEDGLHHEVRWQADRLDATVAHIRRHAAANDRCVELNALVQAIAITQDRTAALRAIVDEVTGLSLDDAQTAPFLAVGTHDEIADHFRRCRDRWGITYFTVREIDTIAPVIERLRPEPR